MSRKVVIAYAYAVVEGFKSICIGHVNGWVPPGVLAHRALQIRRFYSYCILFLALSSVTIAVWSRFVAAKLGEHIVSTETG